MVAFSLLFASSLCVFANLVPPEVCERRYQEAFCESCRSGSRSCFEMVPGGGCPDRMVTKACSVMTLPPPGGPPQPTLQPPSPPRQEPLGTNPQPNRVSGSTCQFSEVCSACDKTTGKIRCFRIADSRDCASEVSEKDCQVPCSVKAPDNGALGACGVTLAHGGTCSPSCNAGYSLVGQYACFAGALSGSPTCTQMISLTANACPVKPPSNGSVGSCGGSLASGRTCTPSCDDGYSLNGQYTCLAGSLSGSPTCTRNVCWVTAPENGLMGDCGPSLASDSTCMPSCQTGYSLRGNFKCKAGVLTGSPTCQPDSCLVRAPANGLMGNCGQWLDSGRTCTPSCERGYSLQGQYACRAGVLSGNPTCEPEACPVDPPENGRMGDCLPLLASGRTCKPSCKIGYSLRGQFACHAGILTGNATCQPDPCLVAAPENGFMGDCPRWLESGRTCTPGCYNCYTCGGQYACYAGTLTGNPTCKPDCVVTPPAYGSWGACTERLPSGRACAPICNEGYAVQGEFRCDDGYLTRTATCAVDSKKMCLLEAPVYGSLGNCPPYLQNGKKCQPRCGQGFELHGANEFHCTGGRLQDIPTCKAAACVIAVPLYGSLGSCPPRLESGYSCTPACVSGYVPSGAFQCERGNLVRAASCQPGGCSIPAPLYGILGDCSVTLASGAKCCPRCDAGYGLQGEYECQAGSLVSHAICQPLGCPVRAPEYGLLSSCPATLLSGQTCRPSCSYGYALEGEFECQAGSLRRAATCKPTGCNIQAPVYSSFGNCPSTLASGATCVPDCAYGYVADGIFECQAGALVRNATCRRLPPQGETTTLSPPTTAPTEPYHIPANDSSHLGCYEDNTGVSSASASIVKDED
eukprot:g80301.t1